MLTKKFDAGWGVLPLAASLYVLTSVAPALGQSATGAGAPLSIQPVTQPQPGGSKVSDKQQSEGSKVADKQQSAGPKVSDKKPSAPNAVVNLVNMLVKKGVLKEDQAQELIKQADDETYVAQQATKDAKTKADDAAKAASAAAAAANPPGTRHVTYVPEVVKRQLTEQIRQEVMAEAKRDNWASPGAYPEWASRIRFYGDFRLRNEDVFFPKGNDSFAAINFNAINTGPPYLTVGNPIFYPTYDVAQNRQEFLVQARLGMHAEITEGLSADIRIATGNDPSPVSTNQVLGFYNTSNFSKYAAWLDRANLRYETEAGPFKLGAVGGRFANPFWSPTDLVWYRDLGFDGFAFQAAYQFSEQITPFASIGAFPIYNTNFNAGINLVNPSTGQLINLPSNDKYLFGGQVGVRAEIAPNYTARFAVAYFDFQNVQGQLSSPCQVLTSADTCNTDLDRPAFAQKGNTYMALRNILPAFDSAGNQINNNFQYYGLASAFRPLVVSSELDLSHFNPVHVVLDGEYVWNTAFNRGAVGAVAVNNFGSTSAAGALGPFVGGDMGWLARLTVGNPQILHRWDWSVNVGYKYLESDAVIDAFTDPDFGLGGTNLKGYIIGGSLGLADNVWATLRWMSANNVAGAPYAVDVIQLDLNARF
jgi:hypothetical protein